MFEEVSRVDLILVIMLLTATSSGPGLGVNCNCSEFARSSDLLLAVKTKPFGPERGCKAGRLLRRHLFKL